MKRKCEPWRQLRDKNHRGNCKKQCNSTQPSFNSDGETRCQLEERHTGHCQYTYIFNVHTCTDECADIHP